LKGRKRELKAGLRIAAAALTLALFSTSAQAGNPREHDGFFLRMSIGGGHADTELDDESGPGEIELDGIAGDYNFAVGGVISNNLAIHGTFFGWGVEDPDAEISDGVLEAEGELNGNLSMAAIGGGITYYLMPVNIYFSGSVGGAKLYFDSDDLGEEDSDIGIAGDFTVGKEWWVGNSWGLGLAGGMSLHSIPDGEVDENWSGKSFVLRFSSTFN
jgi:hypothetical protein